MDQNSAESLVPISSLATECLLPKLERTLEEMPNIEEFMKNRLLVVEEKLDQLISLLNTITSSTNGENLLTLRNSRPLLVPLIILVGEHHVPNKPWTSVQTTIKVSLIARQLENETSDLHTGSTPTLTKCFLIDFQSGVLPRKSLFFQCLQFLHAKLKKDDWKMFPGAVNSFEWLISQIKYPYLSDFIGNVLPSSLLFADDYNDEYKIHGIHCLAHSIKNLNKADLMRDNWTAVIYTAFHGLLHDKNAIIIDKLMPLLYSILKIIEVDPHSNSNIFTKYDETMRKILFAVEFCSEMQLKPVWVHHLTLCLGIMGDATLHWIDKICDILLTFTTTNDTLLWENILKCLQVCTKNTWMKPNSLKTAEIILRIVLNTTVMDFPNLSQENKLKIFSLAKDCLDLLKYNTDYDSVRNQMIEIKQNDKFHPKFRSILKDF